MSREKERTKQWAKRRERHNKTAGNALQLWRRNGLRIVASDTGEAEDRHE